MKQTLNRLRIVLAFVLMFFSLSAFADLFDIGFEKGKKFCQRPNNPCGISVPDTNGSREEGINFCKGPDNPCGISVPDTNGSREEGINFCKGPDNPCGISVPDTNGSRQDGINFCKGTGNPCGISVPDTNGSRQDGINFCKGPDNPCNISVPDTNGSKKEGKEECQNNIATCVAESPTALAVFNNLQKDAKESAKKEGKKECKDKPKDCFTKINTNQQNEDVPEDFCENKTKNCYSNKYGLYLNAVNAAEPVDANGNVSTILTDITMDVLFNDNDTFLFMTKLDVLESKIKEENQRKETNKKAQQANKTAEQENNETQPTNNFSKDTTKAVITVEQKQLTTSNNTIESAKTIDYYPTTVISSSDEDKPIQLNISKIGAGEVISYPNGIACGEDCQENYPINYPVELFAVPIDSNVSLKEWQGDCEAKTNHITVIMDANKTCIAVFE